MAPSMQAKESEIKFIAEELAGVAKLYKDNLVTIVRYNQLQRDQAKLHGERGQFVAEMARARGKISEINLQIIQLDQDFRTEVLKELREAQGKIAELKERVIAAEDQLKRVDIRAPQSGVVHQLAVHTVGGVIGNGETLMLIVPKADCAHHRSQGRDAGYRSGLDLGANAVVRIMAGNQRTTPEVNGVVTHVSADQSKDEQDQPDLLHRARGAVRAGGAPPGRSQAHPGHAGRGLHPDGRTNPAAIPAQAAARTDRPNVPRAMRFGSITADVSR